MADSKLSALPEATTLDDSDQLFANDSGASKRISVANAKTALTPAPAAGDPANRPGSPALGQFYFDTNLNQPTWWDGTSWITADSGSGGGLTYGLLAGTAPARPSWAASLAANVPVTVPAGAVLPEDHGATPNVNVDQTAYLRAAITAAGVGGCVDFTVAGNGYWYLENPGMADGECLWPLADQVMWIPQGTELRMARSGAGFTVDHRIFRCILPANAGSIITGGGTLRGDVDTATSGNENTHLIGIERTSNISVVNITCTHAWGDGIQVGGLHVAGQPTENIFISNVKCFYSRRQGMSPVAVNHFWCEDSEFAYTGEIDVGQRALTRQIPTCGIDFETNNNQDPVTDADLVRCKMYNNWGSGLNVQNPFGDPDQSDAPAALICEVRAWDCEMHGNGLVYSTPGYPGYLEPPWNGIEVIEGGSLIASGLDVYSNAPYGIEVRGGVGGRTNQGRCQLRDSRVRTSAETEYRSTTAGHDSAYTAAGYATEGNNIAENCVIEGVIEHAAGEQTVASLNVIKNDAGTVVSTLSVGPTTYGVSAGTAPERPAWVVAQDATVPTSVPAGAVLATAHANPNTPSDQTAGLRAAIAAAGVGGCVDFSIAGGGYWHLENPGLADGECLWPLADQVMWIPGGAEPVELRMVRSGAGLSADHRIFRCILPANSGSIITGGGTLRGDVATAASGNENTHLIGIERTSNISVVNITCTHAWGDGIQVGGAYVGGQPTENIFISRVKCLYSRRQGMSPVGVNHIWVEDSEFAYTGEVDIGTRSLTRQLPTCGIDFETNDNNEAVTNASLVRCKMYNNWGAGLNVQNPFGDPYQTDGPVDLICEVRAYDCEVYDNGLIFGWPSGDEDPRNGIEVIEGGSLIASGLDVYNNAPHGIEIRGGVGGRTNQGRVQLRDSKVRLSYDAEYRSTTAGHDSAYTTAGYATTGNNIADNCVLEGTIEHDDGEQTTAANNIVKNDLGDTVSTLAT